MPQKIEWSKDDLHKIKDRIVEGDRIVDIAKDYGVCNLTIVRVIYQTFSKESINKQRQEAVYNYHISGHTLDETIKKFKCGRKFFYLSLKNALEKVKESAPEPIIEPAPEPIVDFNGYTKEQRIARAREGNLRAKAMVAEKRRRNALINIL